MGAGENRIIIQKGNLVSAWSKYVNPRRQKGHDQIHELCWRAENPCKPHQENVWDHTSYTRKVVMKNPSSRTHDVRILESWWKWIIKGISVIVPNNCIRNSSAKKIKRTYFPRFSWEVNSVQVIKVNDINPKQKWYFSPTFSGTLVKTIESSFDNEMFSYWTSTSVMCYEAQSRFFFISFGMCFVPLI